MEVWLKGTGGMATDREFPLDHDRPTYFGSGKANTIVLPDKGIARRAAMIVADRTGFHIYSLVSRSALRINGQRIEDAPLSAGDMLALGEHSFVVEQRDRGPRQAPADPAQSGRTEIVRGKAWYPSAFLYGVAGDLSGKSFPLYPNTTARLGRGEEADIRFRSAQVSRAHARLIASAEGFHLSDEESANGTLVNGQLISTRRLRSGDEIRLGDQTLRFEVLDEADAASDAAAEPQVRGVRCPGRCGEVYPLGQILCPKDGILLVNGRTAIH